MAVLLKTRKMTNCPVFGEPKELSEIVLPTYEGVMKYYLLVKHQLKPTAATKEPTVGDISEVVSVNIERLWSKASIPMLSHLRVLQMIRSYHDKYIKIKKNIKRKNNDEKIKKTLEQMQRTICLILLHVNAHSKHVNVRKSAKYPLQNSSFFVISELIELCVSVVWTNVHLRS